MLKNVAQVAQYDLDGNLIQIIGSTADARRFVIDQGRGRANNLHIAALEGGISGGYRWLYIQKNHSAPRRIQYERRSRAPFRLPVAIYNSNRKYVQSFSSVGAAAKHLGVAQTSLSRCLRHTHLKAAGHYIREIKEGVQPPLTITVDQLVTKKWLKELKTDRQKMKDRKQLMRRVYAVNDQGEVVGVYKNGSAAALAHDVSRQAIDQAVKGCTKLCRGLRWAKPDENGKAPQLPPIIKSVKVKQPRERFSDPKFEIIQYDIYGKLIQRWKNATAASDATGVSKAGISKCVHGQARRAGDYVWKFANR